MALKTIFIVLGAALFVQCIDARSCGCSSSCSSQPSSTGCGCNGNSGGGFSGNGYSGSSGSFGGSRGNGIGVAVANGGGLDVTISSALSPSTLSVYSENSINGGLEVCGALPVLAAVGIDCSLPTSGSVGVQYGCGNGIGVTSDCGAYGFGSGYGGRNGVRYGSGAAGLGGRSGGCGCGC